MRGRSRSSAGLDLRQLGAELGLDLLGARRARRGRGARGRARAASSAISRETISQPTALSGLPAASMNSASPDARESGFGDAGVWAGSSAERASCRAARASAPGWSPSSASDQAARTPAPSRAACAIAAGSLPAARSCWRTRSSSVVQRCHISPRCSSSAWRSAGERGFVDVDELHSRDRARRCAPASWRQPRRRAGQGQVAGEPPAAVPHAPPRPVLGAGEPDGVADDLVACRPRRSGGAAGRLRRGAGG